MPMPNDSDDDDEGGVISGPGGSGAITLSAPDPDEETDDDATSDDDTPPDGGDPAAKAALQAAKKEGGQQQQKGKPGRPGSREERRNLWKQNQELRSTLKAVNDQLRGYDQKFAEMRDQILAGVQQRAPGQQQGGPQASPMERELDSVDQALAAEIKLMRAHDPEKGDYDLRRYNQLDAQKKRLIVRMELAEQGITPEALQRMRQGPEAYGKNAQQVVRYQTLVNEFPWLQQGENSQRVGAYRRYLLASGRPDNLETDREAAMHIQNEMGGGQRRAPQSPVQRQRRAGVPFGMGETPSRRAPREVTIDRSILEGTGLSMPQLRDAVFTDE